MNTLLKQRNSTLKQAISENEFAVNLIKEKINLQEKYLDDLSKDKEDKIQEDKKEKEEEEKKSAVVEAGTEMEKESAKKIKHEVKFDSKQPKRQFRQALQK